MTPDERITDSPPPPDTAESPLGDYREPQRKTRWARLRIDRVWDWGKWGALVAGVGWLLLLTAAFLVSASRGEVRDDRLELFLLMLGMTPIMVIVASAVGTTVGALIDFIRPIYLALFNTKQFEREYRSMDFLANSSQDESCRAEPIAAPDQGSIAAIHGQSPSGGPGR